MGEGGRHQISGGDGIGKADLVTKPVHTVCGERKEKLAFVTVYIPSPSKFKNPY